MRTPATPTSHALMDTIAPYLGLFALRATPAPGGFINPTYRAVLSQRIAGQADVARVWIAGDTIAAFTHDGHRGDWYANATDAFAPTPLPGDLPPCSA
jgi:hypothetical protein